MDSPITNLMPILVLARARTGGILRPECSEDALRASDSSGSVLNSCPRQQPRASWNAQRKTENSPAPQTPHPRPTAPRPSGIKIPSSPISVLPPLFGILLSPIIAAAAMSLSSVSVIGNALRLRRTPHMMRRANEPSKESVMVPRLLVLTGVLLTVGCTAPPLAPTLSTDHPASVDAIEARYAPPQSVLVEDRAGLSPGPASQPASPGAGHEHHGAAAPPATTSGAGTSSLGQTTTRPQVVTATYTCPMHADVVSDAPGKCPKCGMDLVKKPSTGGLTPHEGERHE